MALIYPGAHWQPLPGSHGGAMSNHRGLVSHITTDEGNPWNYFSNPANKASSHFIIQRDGTVIQCLDLLVASWAQAGGNYDWVSVEVVGAEFTPKSPQQLEAFAQLFAWGHNEPALRWPLQLTADPNGAGLAWHGMGGVAWGNHPNCPGTVRLAQRAQLLARAVQIVGGSPPVPPAPRTLGFGDSGGDVVALQVLLHVSPDGQFGPDTEAAVRAFQGSHGLAVDGYAGPATMAALQAQTWPQVVGSIRAHWLGLGGATGTLGVPTTGETACPDKIGRYNHFRAAAGELGSIYWTPTTGAWSVHGQVRGRWQALGWETSVLGYPTTDETVCPDGRGRYNHFEHGSIYWTPTTGALEVYGAIRGFWAEHGWESGAIGYPTNPEQDCPEGRFQTFERGKLIFYNTPHVEQVIG